MCRFENITAAIRIRAVSPSSPEHRNPESASDDSRQFLKLAADSIVAVLHEPSELGLSESEAVRLAAGFLDEALDMLGREFPPLPQNMSPAEMTLAQLGRAAGLLRSIADRL